MLKKEIDHFAAMRLFDHDTFAVECILENRRNFNCQRTDLLSLREQ